MNVRVGRLAAILGTAILCFAVPALAQVNMQLTGVEGGIYSGSNDYAGYYYGTVGSQTNVTIVCDDFQNEISIGQSWNATVMNASAIPFNLSNTQFNGTNPYWNIGVVGYAEVATLVEEMFGVTASGKDVATTMAQRDDLSGAIWYLTHDGAPPALTPGATQDLADVQAMFAGTSNLTPTQQADAALAGDTNLWLYTPQPHTSSQEMWSEYNVPEGGAALLYLLLAGAACFGAMVLSSRRQPGSHKMA